MIINYKQIRKTQRRKKFKKITKITNKIAEATIGIVAGIFVIVCVIFTMNVLLMIAQSQLN